MDLVISIVIGALGLVFLLAGIGLTVLVVRYKCKNKDLISQQYSQDRPDVQLVDEESNAASGVQSAVHVELGAVQGSNPRLEELLDNPQWLDDAFGLVPHCLSILKTCHHLTDNLVRIGCSHHQKHPERLIPMVSVAKQISPRVDDVLEAIHPPLNTSQLESRLTDLVLSVSQLAMITKNICNVSGKVDWIDRSLRHVEDHLNAVREAKLAADECNQGRPPSCSTEAGVMPEVTRGDNSPHLDLSDMSQL